MAAVSSTTAEAPVTMEELREMCSELNLSIVMCEVHRAYKANGRLIGRLNLMKLKAIRAHLNQKNGRRRRSLITWNTESECELIYYY